MTDALCLGCGAIKFGAWCPCPKCGLKSSGDKGLDIVFSDHRMSLRNLEQFGEFIKLLQIRCADKDVCFWAFLDSITRCHPSLLKAAAPEPLATQVEALLAKVDMPEIGLEPGFDDIRNKEMAEKRSRRKTRPRWWRFWR